MSRNWPLKLAISLLGLAMVLALLPLSSSAFTLSNTDLHAWRIPEPQAHPSPLQRTELWAPHWLAASITFGPVQEVGPYGVSAWENAWADFDGDGDLDFVQARTETSGYGGTDGGNQYNAFYTNDGSGNFTEHVLSGLENLPSYSAAAGDFDRDGDMDVAIGNVGQNKLYVNDGTGNFTMQAQFGQESTTHVSWGDCNKDGWVDLAVANRGTDYTDGAQNYLYFNNGDGTFSQQSALGTDATYHITWVDYDADGDLDLAVANLGQNYLYINDGSCNLTAQAQFGNSPTQDIEFGDLDGDGDLDAIVANGVYGSSADNANNYPNQVCWQQNDHSFSCENAFNQYSSRSASIADLDGDGDLDVVITNDTDNQPSILFENDGAGNFTETSLSDTAQGDDKYWKSRGELVDIDADGDKDYIAAQYCHHAQCPVSILLQNQTPLTNPSNTGLVADYRFETCGSSHYAYTGDHTGTLPDGILRGNATITADGEGKIYRAYEGDGSNGTQMTVGDNDNGTPDDPSDDTLSNPALDILGDLTLAAWVNPNGYPSWIEIIVSRSHEGEFWLGRDSNGYLVYAHNSGDIITSAAQVLPGGWHHVALVRTGTSGNYLLRFYVDGELKDTVTYTQDIQETDHLLEIGSCQFVCGGLNFNGKIDEVKIYNRALTDDDILQTYTNENLGLNADGTERCSGWCEPGALSTVQNGSFEDSASGSAPTGWVGGQVTNSTTVDPKPDGSQYGFTWPGEAFYQDIPISAGSDYTVTFHAGSHQPEDGDKTISIQYLDNNHQPLGNPAVHIITKDVDTDQLLSQMRRLHLDAAPTDAAFLRIAIDAGSSDYAKIDAVCVYGEEATATASLGDFVWEDMNGNGIQESGEPGMANVTVELYSGDACSGSAIITTTTDTNGNYSFTNLAPGTYSLKFITPSGYDFSPANQGDDTTDSDADPTTGCTGQINLTAGENDTTWDAGLAPLIDLSISKDLNDTTPQVGDIVTFTITIYNEGTHQATGIQVTDLLPTGYEYVGADSQNYDAQTGLWTIGALNPNDSITLHLRARILDSGNYQNWAEITAADQRDVDSDPTQDHTVDDLKDGQPDDDEASAEPDAVIQANAQLGDFVWWDIDRDGVQDPGEPGIPNVSLSLSGTSTDATTTDASGIYTFSNLLAGDYTVTVDPDNFTSGPLKDWEPSPQNAGDDTADSDGDPTTHDASVTLATNEINKTIDFGFTITTTYTLTKQLNTPDPVRVGHPISFTIRITNTGKTWLSQLPLRDSYNTGYLAYGYNGQYANPDSDDHQNDGQIDWSDVLGGNPLALGASISVTVYFTAKADTTSLPGGKTTNSTQTHDGLADPDGPNGPLGALEPLPTQSDEAQVAIIQPTGLIVQRFRALAMGQWVRLSWHTLNEADIVGFRLLRTDAPGHPFQLITPFIPAQVTGQPEGATYMLMDELPSEEPAIYQLEVIHQQGQTDTIQAKTLPWFSIFFQK